MVFVEVAPSLIRELFVAFLIRSMHHVVAADHRVRPALRQVPCPRLRGCAAVVKAARFQIKLNLASSRPPLWRPRISNELPPAASAHAATSVACQPSQQP